MRAIVTGMNGTVAPALAKSLTEEGHTVLAWDRSRTAIDDPDAIHGFLDRERPDRFFHVATGPPAWAELVAGACAERSIEFLFTSSVSVYSSAQIGPFSVEDPPEPDDDYGRYKLECEQRVTAACPNARVVRLGWQIGDAPGGNHMVDHLDRTFREGGRIDAGTEWYPACSFLSDTGDSLVSLVRKLPPGLYHLDGNPGLSFHTIVAGLNRLRGEPWVVRPAPEPVQNNLMVDHRLQVAPITGRIAI